MIPRDKISYTIAPSERFGLKRFNGVLKLSSSMLVTDEFWELSQQPDNKLDDIIKEHLWKSIHQEVFGDLRSAIAHALKAAMSIATDPDMVNCHNRKANAKWVWQAFQPLLAITSKL